MTPEAQKLILEAHEKGTEITKSILEKSFPELFKPFKNGEWIKKIGEDLLLRITDIEKGAAYGLDDGHWLKESSGWSFRKMPEHWQKATEAEVISAFKKEFEKRGFKEGVKFNALKQFGILTLEFTGLDFDHFFNKKIIEIDGQCIYSNNFLIYKDGVFAEIVEEKKTIEQRLKTAFIDVYDKASCIHHWHNTGKNDEGMVVSSKHVHELWEVLEKYKSFRNFL